MAKSNLKKPELPVDHGWAWLVMFGAFVNVLIILSFNRSGALLFIQFLDKFKESATVTTLSFGISCAAFSISNMLVASFLLPRFTVRTLTLTGSSICAASILGMAFSDSMTTITIMYATLGFSHGLVFVPQTALIGYYFRKRLNFANAFSNLGLGIATMASPLVTQVWLDTYGLQGTLLLFAALTLHNIPASLLFRPLSEYRSLDATEEEIEHYNDNGARDRLLLDKDIETIDMTNGITDIRGNPDVDNNIVKRSHKKSDCSDDYSAKKGISVSHTDIYMGEKEAPKKASSRQSLNYDSSLISDFIDHLSHSSSIRYLSNTDFSLALANHQNSTNGEEQKFRAFSSNIHGTTVACSVKKMSAADFDHHTVSTCSISVHSHKDDEMSLRKTSKFVSACSKIKEMLCQSVYTNPLGIMLILGAGLCVHSQAGAVYMPVLGQENGVDTSKIPYLLTVSGAADLICKLSIGYFADLGYFKRSYITCFFHLILGVTFQFTMFCKGFGPMVALSLVFGFCTGVMHFMISGIVVDVLGVDYIGHVMSGYLLVNGIVFSSDHIIVGYLKDTTDSFVGGYHYMGVLTLIAVAIILSEPLLSRLTKTEKK